MHTFNIMSFKFDPDMISIYVPIKINGVALKMTIRLHYMKCLQTKRLADGMPANATFVK